jgi:CDGSH-type Zn-finger protein
MQEQRPPRRLRPQAHERPRSVLRSGGSGYPTGVPAPEEVVIVPYRDGPYLVRGPVVMRDQLGAPIPALRQPIALCRCGKSRIRPFCDGTHQLIRFQAASGAERAPGVALRQGPSRPSPAARYRGAERTSALPRLRTAHATIEAALQTALTTADRVTIASAQSLVLSALFLSESPRGEGSLAAGTLFLVQGALQALAPLTSAGHELAMQAMGDLQRAAADLVGQS